MSDAESSTPVASETEQVAKGYISAIIYRTVSKEFFIIYKNKQRQIFEGMIT